MSGGYFKVRIGPHRFRFRLHPAQPVPAAVDDGQPHPVQLRAFFRHMAHPDERDRIATIVDAMGDIRLGLTAAKVSKAWERAVLEEARA